MDKIELKVSILKNMTSIRHFGQFVYFFQLIKPNVYHRNCFSNGVYKYKIGCAGKNPHGTKG